MAEIILDKITHEDKNGLVKKLREDGFKVSGAGFILPCKIPKKYPKRPVGLEDEKRIYAPVHVAVILDEGIGKTVYSDYLMLTNTEEENLKNYHNQIKDIAKKFYLELFSANLLKFLDSIT